MKTLILNADESSIALAGKIIREGGLVAIPTETVYGLAANALDKDAVGGIFRAKGRPQDNPLIVHIASSEAVRPLVTDMPDEALRLADAFWPGPLTMVLPRSELMPDNVTAGLDTVAVRCPSSGIAREVIEEAGVPLAAPSANISGRPSPTEAVHVLNDMDGKIGLIIDGGRCEIGLESTVFDVRRRCVLRPGGISGAQIKAVIGDIDDFSRHDDSVPRSPGMKYRHYAPKAPLTVLRGSIGQAVAYVMARPAAERAGVLCFDGEEGLFAGAFTVPYGKESEPAELSRNLFGALRTLDGAGLDHIYSRLPENTADVCALLNRLNKAADLYIEL